MTANIRTPGSIFSVTKTIEEMTKECTQDLQIVKAYDTVNREMLCQVLNKVGLNGKIIQLKYTYSRYESKIQAGDTETD